MKKYLNILICLLLIFVLVACGNEDTKKSFTVFFNTDGAGEISPVKVEEGNKVTKPIDITKDGYNFLGWFNGDKEWNFEVDVVNSNVTLKAHWDKDEVLRKITIKYNDGITDALTIDLEDGGTFDVSIYNKDGYTLDNVNIPSTIKSDLIINYYPITVKAVSNNYSVTGCVKGINVLNIPSSISGINITTIGDEAFSNNKDIKELIINEGVTKIGDDAFSNCSNLEKVTFPNSLESIGVQCFYNCTNLKSVSFGSGLKTICEYGFWKCSSLEEISLPDSLVDIFDSAFQDCTSLKTIAIPSKISKINCQLFDGCTNLESVVIPTSVNNISNIAFNNCTKISKIYYMGKETDSIVSNIISYTKATVYYYSETKPIEKINSWHYENNIVSEWTW